MILDIRGRAVEAGDVIKVPHFTAYNGRKCYMFKLVVRCDNDFNIDPNGKYLFGVSITDIWRELSLDKAHRYLIGKSDVFEIVDDCHRDDLCFWERPRNARENAELKASQES